MTDVCPGFGTMRQPDFIDPMRHYLPEFSSSQSWHRQIVDRVVLLWPLKAVGTMIFMALFFWGYFAVLNNPLFAAVTMPATFVDAWIPFSTAAFPAYVSLWVYVSLPPALIGSLPSLLRFGVWIAALCLFCLGIFWLLPTAVPMADIDWTLHPEMAVIKGLDAAGNACPSLHVASAVFSAFWLQRLFRNIDAPRWLRGISAVHCLVILWSTIATRQHVVLDVVAGVAVGVLFAWLSLRQVERAGDTI